MKRRSVENFNIKSLVDNDSNNSSKLYDFNDVYVDNIELKSQYIYNKNKNASSRVFNPPNIVE